jgi:hypothetical protein
MASEASINPSIDNSTISNATKLRSEQVLKYDRTDFFQAAGTGREV